jgi:hypothetical protein
MEPAYARITVMMTMTLTFELAIHIYVFLGDYFLAMSLIIRTNMLDSLITSNAIAPYSA